MIGVRIVRVQCITIEEYADFETCKNFMVNDKFPIR